jgi:hypothetical protein
MEEEFDLKSYLDRLHRLKENGSAPPAALLENKKKSVGTRRGDPENFERYVEFGGRKGGGCGCSLFCTETV